MKKSAPGMRQAASEMNRVLREERVRTATTLKKAERIGMTAAGESLALLRGRHRVKR